MEEADPRPGRIDLTRALQNLFPGQQFHFKGESESFLVTRTQAHFIVTHGNVLLGRPAEAKEGADMILNARVGPLSGRHPNAIDAPFFGGSTPITIPHEPSEC
jgi:hypothetical protein